MHGKLLLLLSLEEQQQCTILPVLLFQMRGSHGMKMALQSFKLYTLRLKEFKFVRFSSNEFRL